MMLWGGCGLFVAVLALSFSFPCVDSLYFCQSGVHDYLMFADPLSTEHIKVLDKMEELLIRESVDGNIPTTVHEVKKCKKLAMGRTLGFHNDGGRGRCDNNCMNNDDSLVLRGGCDGLDRLNLPMHTTWTRATAMYLCTRYIRHDSRQYGIDISSNGTSVAWDYTLRGLDFLNPLSYFEATETASFRRLRDSSRRGNDCSSPQSMETLLGFETRDMLKCWDFVYDMRDLFCHLKVVFGSPPDGESPGAKRARETKAELLELEHIVPAMRSAMSDFDTPMEDTTQTPPFVDNPKITDIRPHYCPRTFGTQDGDYKYMWKPTDLQQIVQAQRAKSEMGTTLDAIDDERAFKFDCAYAQKKMDKACHTWASDDCCNTIRIANMMESCPLTVKGTSRKSDCAAATNCPTSFPNLRTQTTPFKSCARENFQIGTVDKYGALDPKVNRLLHKPRVEGKDQGIPVVRLTGSTVSSRDDYSTSAEYEPTGFSSSSFQLSAASSTYSSMRSLQASDYSVTHLQRGIRWVENNVGRLGSSAVFSMKLAVGVAKVGSWLLERAVATLARKLRLCGNNGDPDECICSVVEPIVDRIRAVTDNKEGVRELMSKNDDCDSSAGVCAVTFMASIGGTYHASAVGVHHSHGIYVTLEFWRDGGFTLGFDVGAFTGVGGSVSIGTDLVKASGQWVVSVGIFFGYYHQISHWKKGFNIGFDVFAHGSVGIDFLFRDAYVDKVGDEQCNPLIEWDSLELTAESAAKTAIATLGFPVHPKCIRGFSVSVEAGVSSTATVASFNVHTSYGVGKSFSILGYNSGAGMKGALVDAATLTSEISSEMTVQSLEQVDSQEGSGRHHSRQFRHKASGHHNSTHKGSSKANGSLLPRHSHSRSRVSKHLSPFFRG